MLTSIRCGDHRDQIDLIKRLKASILFDATMLHASASTVISTSSNFYDFLTEESSARCNFWWLKRGRVFKNVKHCEIIMVVSAVARDEVVKSSQIIRNIFTFQSLSSLVDVPESFEQSYTRDTH